MLQTSFSAVCVRIDGKGTPVYAAGVIGDTVEDALKNTAGPSLYILIKLENILAIALLLLFVTFSLIH